MSRTTDGSKSVSWVRLVAVIAVLGLLAAACGGDDTASESGGEETSPTGTAGGATETGAEADGSDDQLAVAFFAASSQNGFNAAVFEGIEAKAQELGIETEIFDGEFNAEVQFNQLQDLTGSGRFDGFVLLPNDTVGIVPAVEDAIEAGIPTVTTLFPLGPDLNTLEPQVDGLTASVGIFPAKGARLMAEEVVRFCEDIDPCRVVVMVGQLQFPFDNVRNDAFEEVLGQHDNIEIIATGEGNYNRDQALTEMQDILQAQEGQEIHAVLSGADQHLFGIEIALEEAGRDVEETFLIGLGAAKDAVTKIREGRWDATKADFPFTMGQLALEQVVNELRGQPVQQVIDMDEVAPVPPILTQEVLEEHPDFEGQFEG